MMHTYSKGIEGNPQFPRDLFSQSNLFALFFLVIAEHQIPLAFSQFLLYAPVQTAALLLDL